MTKLISLRVVVPTDDDVTTDTCQETLRQILEAVPVSDKKNGERIHWLAVGVSRVVERGPQPRRAAKPGAKVTPPAEGLI